MHDSKKIHRNVKNLHDKIEIGRKYIMFSYLIGKFIKYHLHAGVSSNKNDKFEHVHMQKNQHFNEKYSFP